MKHLFTILLVSLALVQFSFAQDITSFPYFTGFEGTEGTGHENYPDGWTSEDLNVNPSMNQTWRIVKNSSTYTNAHTDSSAIHMMSHFNEANNDWLYTPSIQMTAGNTYRLKFWYKVNDFMSEGNPEKLKVHVSKSNTATEMELVTAIWDEDGLTNANYVEAIIDYVPEETDVFYFGFNYYSDALTGIFLIDDVTIEEVSSTYVGGVVLNSDFEVYYSDFGSTVDVQFESITEASHQINIYNICGQIVKTETIGSGVNKVQFITSDLEKGIFIVNVISSDNKQSSKRFIIR